MGQQSGCCACSEAPEKVKVSADAPKSEAKKASQKKAAKKNGKGKQQEEEEPQEEEAEEVEEEEPPETTASSKNSRNGSKQKEQGRKQSKEKEPEPPAAPEKNLLVQSLMADFQESLRAKFKTRKQAFDKLGGSDDARIDEYEFQQFLRGYGYTNGNLNKQLFLQIDVDGDGSICRAEFKALFDKENEELDSFKSILRETFKTRKEAFAKLGGKDDGKIDKDEFKKFVAENMGIRDAGKAEKIFNAIDDNRSGDISNAEFKALFQPDGEVAKVMEFKEDLRLKFQNKSSAFSQLGGGDDGRIDRMEFRCFLEKHLGYENHDLNDQLFNIVDDDNNGYITKGEFEALFLTQTAKAAELRNKLKEKLQEKFKSRKQAFNWLGGGDDDRIDHEEFQEFMRKNLGSENVKDNEELFLWMDQDNDGYVTIAEFKTFF